MNGLLAAGVKIVSIGARPTFQLILLAIFIYFFGLPIIETYQKKEVMTLEKKRNTHGIPLPAITIAVWDQTDICYDLDESIENCIDKKSLNRSDFLKGAMLGFETRTTVNLTKDMFTEDSTHPWSGKYYTLNLPFKIGPNDQLYLFLANTTLFTTIFIHDPKLFVYAENPGALPMELTSFKTSAGYSHVYRLELTEMNELNVPNDPCNPNPHYNFRTCVKQSVSKQVLYHFVKLNIYTLYLHFSKLFPF